NASGMSLTEAAWGENSGRLVTIDGDGFIWTTAHGRWIQGTQDNRLKAGIIGPKVFRADHSGKAVVQYELGQGRARYVSFDGPVILAVSDKESVLRLLRDVQGIGAHNLALNRVGKDTIYFETYADRKLLGILSLDIHTLGGGDYYPVESPGRTVEGSPYTKIAILDGEREPRILMITTSDDEQGGKEPLGPRGWSAWELRGGRVAEKIVEPDQPIKSFYLFNTKVFNTGFNDVFHAPPVCGSSVFFSFESESAYVLDAGENPPRPFRIFHPG